MTTHRPVNEAPEKRRPTRSKAARLKPHAPSLELFQKESCPYSHSVRSHLSKLGLDFIAHSVDSNQPLKHRELVTAGGKDMIPFLVDHTTGTKLYEHNAIIAYLEKQYGKAEILHPIQDRILESAWKWKARFERAQRLGQEVTDSARTFRGTFGLVRDILKRERRPDEPADPNAARAEAEASAASSMGAPA